MSPAVEAAIIAGSVGVLTLIGTLAAQYYGIRRTSKDTLNARFATAADKLGSEAPAVRLAGVYAMAGLADDWPENRQTCVDVLCGYLRLPYEPDPGQDAPVPERLAFRANREVRHTVIRVITAHLKKDAAVSWQGLNFDFTGVVFDGGDFAYARFSGGNVSFVGAEFPVGTVSFVLAEFSDGWTTFTQAKFSGGYVVFSSAKFSGSRVGFRSAEFSGGTVNFDGAEISGGWVGFGSAEFSGGRVGFGLKFSGGTVNFGSAKFSGGTVGFTGARFSGSSVDFGDAEFSGGTVDFSRAGDWSVPPAFDWLTGSAPQGVKLPGKQDPPQC
jgi:hypothetical protein